MSLKEQIKNIFRVIKDKGLFIIVFTLILSGVSAYYNFMFKDSTTIYSNTKTLLIVSKNEADSAKFDYESGYKDRLINTLTKIGISDYVMEKVVKENNTNISKDEMRTKISISPEVDSDIIKVLVSGTDKEKTLEEQNSFLKVYQQEINELYPGIQIKTISDKDSVIQVTSKEKAVDTAMQVFVGFLFSIVLVLVSDYLKK